MDLLKNGLDASTTATSWSVGCAGSLARVPSLIQLPLLRQMFDDLVLLVKNLLQELEAQGCGVIRREAFSFLGNDLV